MRMVVGYVYIVVRYCIHLMGNSVSAKSNHIPLDSGEQTKYRLGKDWLVFKKKGKTR